MTQNSAVVIMHVSHMFLLYRKLSRAGDSSFGLDVVKAALREKEQC